MSENNFARKHITVSKFQRSNENFMSRSQAKQLLESVEQATEIIFDFKGIAWIGPSFADQIFRVFANVHPDIHLTPLHANTEVMKMISRAQSAGN